MISNHRFKVLSYPCLNFFDILQKGDGETIEEEFDKLLIEILSKLKLFFGILINFGGSMMTQLLLELEEEEMVEESCDGKQKHFSLIKFISTGFDSVEEIE